MYLLDDIDDDGLTLRADWSAALNGAAAALNGAAAVARGAAAQDMVSTKRMFVRYLPCVCLP